MEGSSPVIPGSLSQSSRTKRQTEAKGKCKNGCHSHIGAMSGLSRMPRPPPSWNSSDKKQEKERSECKKNREMCRSHIGGMGVISGPPGPVGDTPPFLPPRPYPPPPPPFQERNKQNSEEAYC
ncbi:vasodilator-stimulated phosphoprotein-like [Coregonus clupeaformis]|uniref:vasodilator-stimulated phosphoprotein-like n=1 Tax=Coregonus clupeaformis TaxID=59861 RepID=UPI001E1C5C35|nr:vasodilator-stimulated phosphoprotein-like [Coregonus clupeaformis]